MRGLGIIIRIIVMVSIPIIARYFIMLGLAEKKIYTKDKKILSFSKIFKILSILVTCLTVLLVLASYIKSRDIVDLITYSPLIMLWVFSICYFCGTCITIFDDYDYFLYRNLLFYVKKIYYKDIKHIQVRLKTLHVTLNNGKVLKIMDIDFLDYEFLSEYLKKRGVKELTRTKQR